MKFNNKSNEVDMKKVVDEFTTPVGIFKDNEERVMWGELGLDEAEAQLESIRKKYTELSTIVMSLRNDIDTFKSKSYDVKDYTKLNKITDFNKGSEV